MGLAGRALAWLLGWFHWLRRCVLHVVTRKSTIERILDRAVVTPAMVALLRSAILDSKVLGRRGLRQIIIGEAPFAVEDIAIRITEAKRIRANSPRFRSRILPNLQKCLAQLNGVNLALERLLALKCTAFNGGDDGHETLLEELWDTYIPGTPRVGGRITTEWGALGFQGKDPASDFRWVRLQNARRNNRAPPQRYPFHPSATRACRYVTRSNMCVWVRTRPRWACIHSGSARLC